MPTKQYQYEDLFVSEDTSFAVGIVCLRKGEKFASSCMQYFSSRAYAEMVFKHQQNFFHSFFADMPWEMVLIDLEGERPIERLSNKENQMPPYYSMDSPSYTSRIIFRKVDQEEVYSCTQRADNPRLLLDLIQHHKMILVFDPTTRSAFFNYSVEDAPEPKMQFVYQPKDLPFHLRAFSR